MSNLHENGRKDEGLTIFWMTDLHMKDSVTGQPDAENAIRRERHFYAAKDKLQHAVAIINVEKPDYVVCTGDMTDDKQPMASFMQEWSRIGVPKAITPGNHDMPNGYEEIVEQLGYAERPVIAGSKFNQAISLVRGGVAAKLLLLDTNIGEDGQHRMNVEGTIQPEAFEWLEHELNNGPERTILVCSHNGLGGPEKYFDQQHVQRFAELAARAIEARPELRIYNLAGHHHVFPEAVVKELSPGFTFINGVAMIANAASSLNVVTVGADGEVELSYREVGYPYKG